LTSPAALSLRAWVAIGFIFRGSVSTLRVIPMTTASRRFDSTSHHSRSRCRFFRPRLEVLEARTLPSIFVVTNLNDSGAGSLRQAILDANANPGADTIQFAPGLQGAIFLTGGEMDITDPLTIQVPGPNQLIVAQNGLHRVFGVFATSASISGMEVVGGAADKGGGILNAGGALTLSIASCALNESFS
jgi:hypothetical protein